MFTGSQYPSSYPCTAKIAAEITHMSVTTASRRLNKLRKEKGYKKYQYVSVGEFCDWLHIS